MKGTGKLLAPLAAGMLAIGVMAHATIAQPTRAAAPAPGPRGYALVDAVGDHVPKRSKGVVGVRNAVYRDSTATTVFGAYCFDLRFRPVVITGSVVAHASAVGSAALTLMSAGPDVNGDLTLDQGEPIHCPKGFRDAAIVIRDRNNRLGMSFGGVFVLFH